MHAAAAATQHWWPPAPHRFENPLPWELRKKRRQRLWRPASTTSRPCSREGVPIPLMDGRTATARREGEGGDAWQRQAAEAAQG